MGSFGQRKNKLHDCRFKLHIFALQLQNSSSADHKNIYLFKTLWAVVVDIHVRAKRSKSCILIWRTVGKQTVRPTATMTLDINDTARDVIIVDRV